jgi:hypothetical protein
MDQITYVAMLQGLILTILEKQKVLGIADSKHEVLTLLNLIEDMELFWNADKALNPQAEMLQKFMKSSRKTYKIEGRRRSG